MKQISKKLPLQGDKYSTYHIKQSIPLFLSIVLIIIILFIYRVRSGSPLNDFQIKVLVNGGVALSFASVGIAAVIISGGFDASVGSVITLINVLAATSLRGNLIIDIPICLMLIILGTAAGFLNGFLIAYAGIQSIIATLATNFVWFGVGLLILKEPGGYVPGWFSTFFQGTYIDSIPNSIFWILSLILFIIFFRKSKFYRSIFSIGSDPESAYRNGINVKITRVKVYALAGFFYGIAGLFLTAQTTSGDPNIGLPFMLLTFSAVVVGGTPFGGGKGSLFSGITGGYILRLLDSVLISVGITSYFNDIVQGSIMLIAVVLNSRLPIIRSRIKKTNNNHEKISRL